MRLTTAYMLSLPLAAILAACSPGTETSVDSQSAPVPDVAQSEAPAQDAAAQCGADTLDDFINALPTSDILGKIKERIGDRTIRVVGPHDAITRDFRVDRLNVETGEDGRIKQFRCY